MNDKLYKQRENHIPVEIGTKDVSSMNYFTNLNFSKMEDLADEWQIEPEYFDTSAGLFDNIKEEIEESRKAHADMQEENNMKVNLDFFGLKSLNPFGFIDCAITWITRIGGFIAIYMCLRRGC